MRLLPEGRHVYARAARDCEARSAGENKAHMEMRHCTHTGRSVFCWGGNASLGQVMTGCVVCVCVASVHARAQANIYI